MIHYGEKHRKAHGAIKRLLLNHNIKVLKVYHEWQYAKAIQPLGFFKSIDQFSLEKSHLYIQNFLFALWSKMYYQLGF